MSPELKAFRHYKKDKQYLNRILLIPFGSDINELYDIYREVCVIYGADLEKFFEIMDISHKRYCRRFYKNDKGYHTKEDFE